MPIAFTVQKKASLGCYGLALSPSVFQPISPLGPISEEVEIGYFQGPTPLELQSLPIASNPIPFYPLCDTGELQRKRPGRFLPLKFLFLREYRITKSICIIPVPRKQRQTDSWS